MSGRSRAPHNEQVTLDLDGFLRDGYVVIRGAVAASTASTCRRAIWDALGGQGIRADEPATWPPLVHLDNLDGGPFTRHGFRPRWPTPICGSPQCCAGAPPAPPAEQATSTCAIHSSCTPLPGRTAAECHG